MKVAHLHRRPFPGSFSIERLFAGIREELRNSDAYVSEHIAPEFSKGLLPRLRNRNWAKNVAADVLHVTGDIHYVAIGIDARRTILTIHDTEMLSRSRGFKHCLLKKFWFDLPLKHVAAVTVISEATKSKLVNNFNVPSDSIVFIPNYVDPKFKFSPYPSMDGPFRILHMGTKKNKNLLRTIQAIEDVDCQLEIVGKLSREQSVALEQSTIKFVNHVDISDEQLVQLYQECHLLCFVSTEEGFGLPILEAQATGRPIVTSNCSSMPEVAGKGACLVDPYDIRDIRQGLSNIIQDANYRNSLIEEGADNVKKYDRSTVSNQYLELYRRIAVSCK